MGVWRGERRGRLLPHIGCYKDPLVSRDSLNKKKEEANDDIGLPHRISCDNSHFRLCLLNVMVCVPQDLSLKRTIRVGRSGKAPTSQPHEGNLCMCGSRG